MWPLPPRLSLGCGHGLPCSLRAEHVGLRVPGCCVSCPALRPLCPGYSLSLCTERERCWCSLPGVVTHGRGRGASEHGCCSCASPGGLSAFQRLGPGVGGPGRSGARGHVTAALASVVTWLLASVSVHRPSLLRRTPAAGFGPALSRSAKTRFPSKATLTGSRRTCAWGRTPPDSACTYRAASP